MSPLKKKLALVFYTHYYDLGKYWNTNMKVVL